MQIQTKSRARIVIGVLILVLIASFTGWLAARKKSDIKTPDNLIKNQGIIVHGNISAYTSTRDNKNVIVINQNGIETIADSVPNDTQSPDEYERALHTQNFFKLQFSQIGNYLQYTVGGYENSELRVYDIKNKKLAFRNDNGGGHGEFNAQEKLYFFCNSDDFSGDYVARVYELPEFKIKLDLLKQVPGFSKSFLPQISCSFDQEKNLATFGIKTFNADNQLKINKVYKFDFNSGELIN